MRRRGKTREMRLWCVRLHSWSNNHWQFPWQLVWAEYTPTAPHICSVCSRFSMDTNPPVSQGRGNILSEALIDFSGICGSIVGLKMEWEDATADCDHNIVVRVNWLHYRRCSSVVHSTRPWLLVPRWWFSYVNYGSSMKLNRFLPYNQIVTIECIEHVLAKTFKTKM